MDQAQWEKEEEMLKALYDDDEGVSENAHGILLDMFESDHHDFFFLVDANKGRYFLMD